MAEPFPNQKCFSLGGARSVPAGRLYKTAGYVSAHSVESQNAFVLLYLELYT